MKDKFFIDTNILVYSFSKEEPEKKEIASGLIHSALQSQKGVISYQVIQEFLNVSTKKFPVPLKSIDAAKYIDLVLNPLCQVFSSITLYKTALEIKDRWQYSFYDSLIISAALESNCSTLFSEDLHHSQKINSLEIINPFIALQ